MSNTRLPPEYWSGIALAARPPWRPSHLPPRRLPNFERPQVRGSVVAAKGPAIGPRPGRRIAVSQAPPRPIIRYGRGRDGGRTAAQLAAKAIRCPPGTNQQRARCPAPPRQWPSAGLPCGPVEQVLARAFRPRPLRAGPPARRQGGLDGLISERRRCRRRCPSLPFSLPMAPRGNRAIAAGVQLRSGALRSPQRPAARLVV